MSSRPNTPAAARRLPFVSTLRRPHWTRADLIAFGRRLVHFWLVWSALLLLHEGGHALSAWRQGLAVERVTVGVGPELWRGEHDETQLVLRAVPLAGMTNLTTPSAAAPDAVGVLSASPSDRWRAWGQQVRTLFGGVLATLAVAVAVGALVAGRERFTHRRWVWGRIVVADALVLTVFNFLPVPPLDGGRAVLGAVTAWRGAPLAGDALFWVQVGGLALAVVPMALWTKWTTRIDRFAMRWKAPLDGR